MNDILKGHQALLGIVLGYGRNNSWQFLEKAKVYQPLGCVWGETNEEYTYEEKPTHMTSAEYYMSIYSFPRFAGDPNSEESLTLKSHYMQTRDKVLDYYKGKDFLEASLSLLAQQRAKEYIIFD